MDKNEVIAYFDRCAPAWDSTLTVDEEKIGSILDAAGVGQGSTVLDVACGTGVLFPFYLKRGASRVTGVDISPEMIRVAAAKFHDPRIETVCGDMETLPVGSVYDCCVIYNAFPHFPQPQKLIERLALWVKPGGRLTVAHSMGVEALNRRHAGDAAHVSRGMISAEELSELMSPYFCADILISGEDRYIVSGIRAGRE